MIDTPLKHMSALQVHLLLSALHQKCIVVSQGLCCRQLNNLYVSLGGYLLMPYVDFDLSIKSVWEDNLGGRVPVSIL